MSFDFSKVRAILLGAGRGVRLHSELPKVAHEILGTPMIEYAARNLRAAGIVDILVVVGHRREVVQNILGDTVRYVDQGEPRGTGHAVLCAREALGGYSGPLVVVNGDSPLLSPSTIRALARGIDKLSADAVVMTGCLDDPSGYGRVVRDSAGKIQKIVEDADARMEKTIREVNAGAYAFRCPEIFEVLSRLRPDNARKEYYLTDVVSEILRTGGRVEAARVGDPTEAYGVNTRRDLIAVSNLLRLRNIEGHLENGVTIPDPSSVYIEDGVKIGPETQILPYTVIRRGVVIGTGCVVGPFSHLRAGTVLEDGSEIGNFVEVKNSRIGSRSRAKHLSYLGDAAVGRNVNIGAGTITANYDGKRKHATTIEDGVQTGCNTVLVAPVKMGANSKTGAGAVVPRNHDIAPGSTVVGVPARVLKRGKIGSRK